MGKEIERERKRIKETDKNTQEKIERNRQTKTGRKKKTDRKR